MTKETNVGIHADNTVAHYIASLVKKQNYAGAVRYYEDNRNTIEAAGTACAGIILHNVAKAYASLADYRTALRIARIAQSRISQEGDNLLLAENFVTLGGILSSLSELKEAEKAYRDAESIFRRDDCLEGRSRALNLLAGLFYRQNDYSNSLSILMDAISIARRLGDKKKLAYMMGNIGRIHTFIGERHEARKYLNLSIDLSTELKDWHEVMRSRIALGYVYLREGNYTRSEEIIEEVYPNSITEGSKREEVICLTYLGELRYHLNRLDESRKTLEKALKLASKIGRDSSLAACVMRHLAEVLVRQRNFHKAARFVAKAMVIMEEVNDIIEIAALHRINAMIAEAKDNKTEARDLYSKAIELLEETRLRSEMAEVLTVAGSSALFEPRKRLTFLFRAEAFYNRYQLTLKLQKVDKLISRIEYPAATTTCSPSLKVLPCAENVDFLTNCPDIQRFKSQMTAIGKSDLPVLLMGETGVGKDHLSRYYHHVIRPETPYVAINCASLPETLLESELFGYKRGAFTGADSDKKGLFAAANSGVLLLDEIGDMPLTLQTKLLGVLETRQITPLGSTCNIELDVKLVAATNRDLEEMVESGTFRRDLYYRLSGMVFHIPALRERKEDIPLLLGYFLRQSNLVKTNQTVPPELFQQFMAYDWPGNTRELYNRVKRLEVMADLVSDNDLSALSLSMFAPETPTVSNSLFERIEQFERQLLVEALMAAEGNKSEAARILGIHEATVRSKLKRFGIRPETGIAS